VKSTRRQHWPSGAFYLWLFNEMVLKNPRITTYRRKGESETAESGSACDLYSFSLI